MPNLVVIEDGTVFRMINDDMLAAQIPCLYGKKTIFKQLGGGGCSSCARKREANRRKDMNQIKTCLTGLSEIGRAHV